MLGTLGQTPVAAVTLNCTLTSTLRYLYVTCTLPVRYLYGNLDPGSLGKLLLAVEVTVGGRDPVLKAP